ncbi:MAG: M20 metallopeptidase family protein [Bacteroidia bacterium]
MSTLAEKIKSLADQLLDETIAVRRHLHMHPELSFQETETCAYVWSRLDQIGISEKRRLANTGIEALIRGKNPDSRTIALRADMDALPIKELNQVPYKSTNEGVMHACGHDAHTASLLGAANILHKLKDEFEGTIKLIFQPGEEKLPGGASMMIRDGVLENPKPNGVIGQHVMPLIESGKVGFRSGIYMASTDEIYLRIKGKGGHGAMPHLNIDPVLIASNVIVALQQVVSRHANPTMPSVLSFGKFIANGATNVIPDEAYLEGTFRTLDEKWRAEAHEKIRSIVESVASSMGAVAELEIRKGYPALYNDPALTSMARSAAVEYLGHDHVIDLDIWMAAEDFSYYSQQSAACFYRLGTRNESRGITSSVHTPTFDIEEKSLAVGMGLMAWLAIKGLQQS